MKLLFTGFEPFGGEAVNASYEAVCRLPDRIGNVQIIKAQLPTAFRKCIPVLEQILKTERPDAVVCVGQAAGRAEITPEKVAINYADARIPDNAGMQPIDEALVPYAETAYFSTLPIRSIVKKISDAGIPAKVSYTAGTFVCNCVMYHVLRMAKEQYPSMRAGFIHVPLTTEQAAQKQIPSLPLDAIVRALAIAAEEIAKAAV